MDSFRLLLMRHCLTEANVTNALDSKPPGLPLSPAGQRQAKALAERLPSERIVAVYSSVALRARQTACPIAARHGLAVTALPGVHEVQLGDWEGRRDPETLERYIGTFSCWLKGELDIRVPGGESGREVLQRFLADVNTIRATHEAGIAILVSHGAAIRLASLFLANNLSPELVGARFIPNGGWVVLEAGVTESHEWRCLEWLQVRVE
jgi:broad specificity phosphatase PhoE